MTAATFTRVPHAARRLTPLARDVLGGLLAYCRHAPFCWPGQRRLARDLRRSLGMINRGIADLVEAGAITKRMQRGRQACFYEIDAEFWVPRRAQNASVSVGVSLGTCSPGRTEEESNLKKKEDPVAPEGGVPPDVLNLVEQEAEPIAEAVTFGPCVWCGGERQAPAPTPCQQCGSTRRTPYGQPRHPRPPRRYRRRHVASLWMETFREVGQQEPAEGPHAARLAVPPPAVEIIPPASEVIPFPRQARRGFTPATDWMEAFYDAANALDARDRGDHRGIFSSVPAAGRAAGNAAADRADVG